MVGFGEGIVGLSEFPYIRSLFFFSSFFSSSGDHCYCGLCIRYLAKGRRTCEGGKSWNIRETSGGGRLAGLFSFFPFSRSEFASKDCFMAFLWAFLSDIIHDIETVFLFLFFFPSI